MLGLSECTCNEMYSGTHFPIILGFLRGMSRGCMMRVDECSPPN